LVDAQHIPTRVVCCPQWISTGAWVIFLTLAAMAKSLGAPLLLAAIWCGMGLITLAAVVIAF
jgi:hypothetical protein